MTFSNTKRISAAFFCIIMLLTFTMGVYATAESTGLLGSSVSSEVQEGATDCTCGETAPENLADHADSCPRKQYIRTLFTGKTAAEIYSVWESYDEATRTDILNMMQAYVYTTYDELVNLIKKGNADDDTLMKKYTASSQKGIAMDIFADKDAFPKSTTATVTDIVGSLDEISSVIGADFDIKGYTAVDISFSNGEQKLQPKSKVAIYTTIPTKLIPEGTNRIIVIHIGADGPEIVYSEYIDSYAEDQFIAFTSDSFSHYYYSFANQKYVSTKMSDVLKGSSRYKVVTFNANIFDYDPTNINIALDNAAGGKDKGLHFTGYADLASTNNGVNDSNAKVVKQGMLQSKLKGGIPVFNYMNNGDLIGKILFDSSYAVSGKKIYKDVGFEVIYDSQTGYYEYKSSANHAQYNSTQKKVELYADTLSIKNSYVGSVNLQSRGSYNDISAFEYKNKTLTCAITDANNDSILDPFICFPVNNINASSVEKIYIKFMTNHTIGTAPLQLFFKRTTDADYDYAARAFTTTFTTNGDWVEVAIDTSECAKWNGTINEIRFDPYHFQAGDSRTNGTYTFILSQISFVAQSNNNAYGGYYPFSDIGNSYVGIGDKFSFDNWENDFLNGNRLYASRSVNNGDPGVGTGKFVLDKDLAFGTVLEYDFYLPVDRTDSNDKALIYSFNGDDDLWVFVDDELVLDIGGAHSEKNGTINFLTATATVETAVQLTGYNSGGGTNVTGKTSVKKLSDDVIAAGKHTMKIFYLERGAGVSNCYMKFNLPSIPTGSVEVSKTVSTTDGKGISKLKNEAYTFQISAINNDDKSAVDMSNTSFSILNAKGQTIASKTDSQAKFVLKDGETAYFEFDENYSITVEELLESGQKEIKSGYKHCKTTANSTDTSKLSLTTAKDKSIRFNFVNYYEQEYGSLKIFKNGISELDHNDKSTQTTLFRVTGTSDAGDVVSLDVAVVGNSFVNIEHLPVGNYTVTELTDWSWRYSAETKIQTVYVEGGKTATVTFVNNRKEIKWLSGDCYCENIWPSKKDEEEDKK